MTEGELPHALVVVHGRTMAAHNVWLAAQQEDVHKEEEYDANRVDNQTLRNCLIN